MDCPEAEKFLPDSDWLEVIDQVAAGVVVVDRDGKILVCNQAAAALLNADRKELLGKDIDVTGPDLQLAEIIKDGQAKADRRLQIGGRAVTVHRIPLRRDREVIGAVAVLDDVSETEALTAKLNSARQVNRELEALIEFVAEGIVVTNDKGYITRVNDAYRRLAGITDKEYLGKHFQTLFEEGYTHRTTTDVAMDRKAPFTAIDVRNNRELLITSTPVLNDDGEITAVVGVLRDLESLNCLRDQLIQNDFFRQQFYEELKQLRSQESYRAIITRNPRMRERVETALRVARVNSTVLILGESGVGKELLAQMIHRASRRSKLPFIKVDCTTIPASLMEGELFGYETGSFTGAPKEGRKGLLELAQNGTLFLDEVGDLPYEMQSKILRAIQDKQINRIGGRKALNLDIRIIAATNRDLEKMMKEKTFREDLYYRLNVVPITLPPLRERPEDIAPLVADFLERFNREYGYQKWILPDVIKELAQYDWPGNVRELQNVIERLVVTQREDCVGVGQLEGCFAAGHCGLAGGKGSCLKAMLENEERRLLEESYRVAGSTRKVAALLGISQSAVVKKLNKYGII